MKDTMRKSRACIGALFLLAACGSQPSAAKSAAAPDHDAAEPGARLTEGATVCLSAVLGMRYPVEDALRENQLEPVAQCMFAEVRLREEGKPGAYVLRYQRINDTKWQTCESTQEDRIAFLKECTLQMVDDLGVVPAATAESDDHAEPDGE